MEETLNDGAIVSEETLNDRAVVKGLTYGALIAFGIMGIIVATGVWERGKKVLDEHVGGYHWVVYEKDGLRVTDDVGVGPLEGKSIYHDKNIDGILDTYNYGNKRDGIGLTDLLIIPEFREEFQRGYEQALLKSPRFAHLVKGGNE